MRTLPTVVGRPNRRKTVVPSLLCHEIGASNHLALHEPTIAKRLVPEGFRVIRINFRSWPPTEINWYLRSGDLEDSGYQKQS